MQALTEYEKKERKLIVRVVFGITLLSVIIIVIVVLLTSKSSKDENFCSGHQCVDRYQTRFGCPCDDPYHNDIRSGVMVGPAYKHQYFF